jgi:hypothetical protein
VFLNHSFIADVRAELGKRGTLFAGQQGRRVLVTPSGQISEAAIPLPATILAVLAATDGTLSFLTAEQGVYTATEPLGAYQTRAAPRQPGATDSARQFLLAVGRESFILARSDEMLRYDNQKQTWSNLALYKPAFEPVSLSMEVTGHGTLLLMPHWPFATEDDGVIWKELPGASHLPMVASERPRYLASSDGVRQLGNSEYMSGLPSLAGAQPGHTIGPLATVARNGAEPNNWLKIFGHGCSKARVVGEKNDISVACLSSGGVEFAHYDGKNWAPDGATEVGPDDFVTGPNGWALAFGHDCTPRVRTRRHTPFVAIDSDRPFDEVVVDRVHLVAFALVWVKGAREIWSSSLDKPNFRRLSGFVSNASGGQRMDGPAIGGFRLYSPREPVTIAEYAWNGSLRHHFSPPLERLFPLAQQRALGVGRQWGLMESADGGETWTPVPGRAAEFSNCNTAGCESADCVRVGWQLPSGAKGAIRSVIGPPPSSKAAPPPAEVARVEPLNYDCVPDGPNLPIVPDLVPISGYDLAAFAPMAPFLKGIDLAGDTRWGHFQTSPQGIVQVAFVQKGGKPQRLTLLGPNPPHRASVADSIVDPQGLIVIRYSHQGSIVADAPPAAGDALIEVAWFDTLQRKVYRGRIAGVHFNELPRSRRDDSFLYPPVVTSIGERGLLLHPFGAQGAWFFRHDGTVESVTWPAVDPSPDARPTALDVLSGSEWLVVIETESEALRLFRSRSPWNSWQIMAWPWSVEARSSLGVPQVLRTSNSAMLLHQAKWLFPVAPTATEPSHMPVKLHPTDVSERYQACSPDELGGLPYRVELGRTQEPASPVVRMLESDLKAYFLALRVAEDGHACMAAALFQNEEFGVVLAAHDPSHSWLVVPNRQRFKTAVRPLRCRESTH